MYRNIFRLAALPLTLSLTVTAALSAQDFSAVLGAWEMTVETPRGTMTQTLTFAADGDELKGSISGPQGQTLELQGVTFEEGTLSFQLTRAIRDRQMRQSFSAKLDGDRMTGTVSGERGGRGGGSRDFTAVRSST